MSKKILLIKLSSMGDLMHALPAITDAVRIMPDIRFDWVVDESFAQVPSWHPAVDRIIPSAHRRWKKNIRQAVGGGELKRFSRQLNERDYEVVVDAQNNIKSAVVTFLRRGKSHGMDGASVSESPAHWAYHYCHAVDKSQHAITRQRQLMAAALDYPVPDSPPDYGIDRSRMKRPDLLLPDRYLVFVHNASWTTKLWPESHWHQLIQRAEMSGYSVLLPSGNEEEKQRSVRLVQGHKNAIALPKLSLSEVGGLLMGASGAVCCDTGLCHMAAMLDVPSVSLYGPTSDQLIGAWGGNQQHVVASQDVFQCAPCYGHHCRFNKKISAMSACMESFQPEFVWQRLCGLIRAAEK